MFEIFIVIALVIFVGFFSLRFFEITKVPDVLFLMLVGLLIGPIFKLVDTSPGSVLLSIAPFVGTLALIILIFDGGLHLNLFKVIRQVPLSAAFTFVVFTLTSIFTMLLANLLFSWPFLHGLLLGFVIGGTSSATVILIMSKLSSSEELRSMLILESAITDALSVIFTLALIPIIISNTFDISLIGKDLASAFSVALTMALIFAVVWIVILQRFHGKSFGYMLTLAVVFLLYGLVQATGGNGIIAVFVFAILLGNFSEVAPLLKLRGGYSLDESIKTFQVEISFLVRTFFFVYLGVVFNVFALSVEIVLVALAVLAAILVARYIGTKWFVRDGQSFLSLRQLLVFSMIPRDLASAVLAFVPISFGIKINFFVEIVFLILFLTNLISTIGVFAFENRAASNSNGKKPVIVKVEKRK